MSDAWVYILRCADGSLYTGWTVDLERRLASHMAGDARRYTRSRRAAHAATGGPKRAPPPRREARARATSLAGPGDGGCRGRVRRAPHVRRLLDEQHLRVLRQRPEVVGDDPLESVRSEE